MLTTLVFSSSIKLANHNLDSSTTYISSLDLTGLSIKRGIATDSATLKISIGALDYLGLSLLYLVPHSPVDIYIYDLKTDTFKLALKSYIAKIAHTTTDEVTLTLESRASYHATQFFVPNLESTCQAQAYSKMCGLDKNMYKATSLNITLDGLTGAIPYTAEMQARFPNIEDLYLAHIVMNGYYKARVVGVNRTSGLLYILVHYYDKQVSISSLDIYLYCNKTYGMCYQRFSNTKNFYGFPSIGQTVKNFNIFSAGNITYCGSDVATAFIDTCSTDDNLFGIQI